MSLNDFNPNLPVMLYRRDGDNEPELTVTAPVIQAKTENKFDKLRQPLLEKKGLTRQPLSNNDLNSNTVKVLTPVFKGNILKYFEEPLPVEQNDSICKNEKIKPQDGWQRDKSELLELHKSYMDNQMRILELLMIIAIGNNKGNNSDVLNEIKALKGRITNEHDAIIVDENTVKAVLRNIFKIGKVNFRKSLLTKGLQKKKITGPMIDEVLSLLEKEGKIKLSEEKTNGRDALMVVVIDETLIR